jgi:thioesterase domain-containing protein/aryl carrier-like protein
MKNMELIERIERLSSEEKKILSFKIGELIKSGNLETAKTTSKKLVAYIKLKESASDKELTSFMKKRLPSYMIPTSLIKINEIPRLPNGKVDKNKITLQTKSDSRKEEKEIFTPKNQLEEKLVEIWENILQFSPIHVTDNFFEIGGDSILSIQIVSKARQQGISISPNQLFEYQTIREIVESFSNEENKIEKVEYIAPIREEGNKTPLFCIHSGGGHVFFYGLLKKYLKQGRPIYGVHPSTLDGKDKLFDNIEHMAESYLKSIRKIQPHGPYNLMVYCFSTSVANEIAIKLKDTAEVVNIISVDTMASAWNATGIEALKARTSFFLKNLTRNPFRTIKLFFLERIWIIEPLLVKFRGKEHEKELELLKANLRQISLDYKWEETHNAKTTLILTDKKDNNFENFMIDSWEKYAKGGIKVLHTKGFHTTIFEEPDIAYVSEKIDEAILD